MQMQGSEGDPEVEDLRAEIVELDRLVTKQRDLFMLLEEKQLQTGVRDDFGDDESPEEEYNRLVERNKFIRAELIRCAEVEKRFSNDPRILDKKNEVAFVRQRIAKVEDSIETLQLVKRRRDRGLREICKSEAKAKKVKYQQEAWISPLRDELKSLQDSVRALEREDLELRERVARVQEQLKLGITQKEYNKLKQDVDAQYAKLVELSNAEAGWRFKKISCLSNTPGRITKEHNACRKLEQELKTLKSILTEKETRQLREVEAIANGQSSSYKGIKLR